MKIKQFCQRLIAVIFLACALTGCTNSPLAWKLLYGQFDNFLYRQLNSYADFNREQKAAIREAVTVMASWHRSNELSRYAQYISEFQVRMLDRQPEEADIEWLYTAFRDIGLRLDENSPLLTLTPVMQGLNEQQIQQISAAIDKDFSEETREWEKQSNKTPAEAGAETLKKFFKRLGLRLNKQQMQQVEEQLAERQLTREAQQAIWREWSDQLLQILEARNTTDFAQRFSDHHFARIDLVQTQAPQRWAHDERIYRSILLELFRSLDQRQTNSMKEKLSKIRTVALELVDSGPIKLEPSIEPSIEQ